jgi:hypothetical protein
VAGSGEVGHGDDAGRCYAAAEAGELGWRGNRSLWSRLG